MEGNDGSKLFIQVIRRSLIDLLNFWVIIEFSLGLRSVKSHKICRKEILELNCSYTFAIDESRVYLMYNLSIVLQQKLKSQQYVLDFARDSRTLNFFWKTSLSLLYFEASSIHTGRDTHSHIICVSVRSLFNIIYIYIYIWKKGMIYP